MAGSNRVLDCAGVRAYHESFDVICDADVVKGVSTWFRGMLLEL
jgi:hypothetical protein